MRIAFLSSWSVNDARAWSGVARRMYEALATKADVVPVFTGDVRPALLDRVACRLTGSLADRDYLVGHALPTSIKRAAIVRHRLAAANPDVVLGVAASQDIAFLRVRQPIVLVSDATFHALRRYYPDYSRLARISCIQGEAQEARSLKVARSCALASRWAERSVVRDYSIAPDKCSVIPFGPALEPAPYVPRSSPSDPLRLLMVARDWARKGGDLSVGVFQELRKAGIPVSLTVVGDAPPLPPEIIATGRVDRRAMARLYTSHDVLLELASANCAGVTLTDAAAFGMPSVATDTGGVSTIVQEGATGFLVDPSNDVLAQVSQAVRDLSTPAIYAEMSRLARLRYEERLNWDAWAAGVLRLCRAAMP